MFASRLLFRSCPPLAQRARARGADQTPRTARLSAQAPPGSSEGWPRLPSRRVRAQPARRMKCNLCGQPQDHEVDVFDCGHAACHDCASKLMAQSSPICPHCEASLTDHTWHARRQVRPGDTGQLMGVCPAKVSAQARARGAKAEHRTPLPACTLTQLYTGV